MKEATKLWRRRALHYIAGCVVAAVLNGVLPAAATTPPAPPVPLGPSDRPEAYFNGSSYIRLSRPISLKQLVGLSYRTCVGGELFSQRFEGYTLHVTALFERVVVSWARPGQAQREVALARATLDNRWHWLALRYRPAPPALVLEVDKDTQVIANASWHSELLWPGALEATRAVVLVGNVFSGCILEGPQLEFHAAHAQLRNVVFGHCPLTTDECKDRKDVLRIPPKDHCYNEPCMRHGTCISRHDRYECHCTARYSGNNCEVDAGDPCQAAPCRNGGRCVEDAAGDVSCVCAPQYHGQFCELELSLDPMCVAGPCRNNGSCVVPPQGDVYVCVCAPGFTGQHCEVDIDECAGAACLNGGRCVDAVNNYTCDCSGTGYSGARCESNVNECAERGVCGRGVCYDTYGGYVCACLPGFAGDHCQRAVAAAGCAEEGGAERLCPPHAHCAPPARAPNLISGLASKVQVVCVCDAGYFGASGLSPNCSLASGACAAGVCLNGGACAQGDDHFNCTCVPPYRGTYCESSGAGAPAGAASGKALSELQAERCAAQPCAHAASCVDTATGFHCECEAGWGGARCDAALASECPCPPHQECVESGGARRCVAAAAGAGAACAPSPCHNGTCVPDAAGVKCLCPPGANGHFCELDIDECTAMPKICNHGVCVNLPGSYQCYCRPGYTGDSCEQDIDECLSSPCKNGGTCQNLENNYECTCIEGYSGKDCSVDINECESSPCASGATCVDGLASYTCVCGPGLTGDRCQLDVDDCESAPCLNGGRCVDGLNSYTCECAGTGFSGPDCGTNIDDCLPQPCQHGGSCADLVNGFQCTCLPAYRGARCELDVDECADMPCKHDAVCLQHSDVSLYRPPPPAPQDPVLVGPQPHMLLPAYFYQTFSYEAAAGFECVCVAGTVGARCETNLDECASSPCAHGTCVDGVGEFTCDCLPGFEGELCEHEIDECLSQPCVRGRCVDLRADYLCACDAGWGGRNCSVALEGCRDRPCQNGGTCTPYLTHDLKHAFNCSCAPGYHGAVCHKITTMSLERQSFVEVSTAREEGYDISFRFKTTLGSALLAMGRGLTYFFLELSNGRLNLHSSLLNKWEGVFIGSNLNDSNWQKVFVTINSSHVVLAANEEQTIYPISQNEAYNASVTSFGHTRLGTAGSSYAALTHGPDFFVGCFQDVVVNSHWVLPEDSNATDPAAAPAAAGGDEARATLRGVVAACPRSPQCEPNPCRAAGVCTDAWSTFVCACRRPHLGHTCQYNYTAATFGHESQPRRSRVTVAVHDAARRAVRAALDVSMFIRTREPSGHIFYLGSLPRYGQTDETLVAASLKNGELLVHLRFNHTPEDYTVGGTRLDNAHLHLIEVVRNSTLVQVKLNGTEYFRKSISAAKQLDAQVLYLGGPPPVPAPPSSPAPGAAASPASPAPPTAAPPADALDDYRDEDFFKGVIQDVQVSNGVNVTIVQLFPLVASDVSLPPEFGVVHLPAAGVLPGQVSDDACASTPCRHGAPCATTWNDYTCACPRGYKGKQCAEVEFCQLQGCPRHSLCRNLKQGYECVANATFDGINTTLQYSLAAGLDPALPVEPPTRLSITYRTKLGGTLLMAAHNGSWFSVGVYRGRCTLQWKLGAAWPVARRLAAPAPPPQWASLRVTLQRGLIQASFTDAEGAEEGGLSAPIDVEAWQRLMLHGNIYLGGAPHDVGLEATEATTEGGVIEYTEGEEFPLDNVSGEYFKGCMGEVHVGAYLLPYFTAAELYGAAGAARGPHMALRAGAAWGAGEGVGCVLCLDALCRAGARCRDVRSDYTCACPPGRQGDYCEIDVDECADAACANGATCVDGVANYTCVCAPGYTGPLCEEDIDECASSPCLNGGTCTDGVGAFTCACAGAWRGERCQLRASRSCAQRPCVPPATCTPREDPATGNNYTCECSAGFRGVHCELAFCAVTPCVHGRCRDDTAPPRCDCEEGWEGPLCATEQDACVAAGEAACLHGGRCVPRPALHCDCSGTGYSGARCEVDVDECAVGLVSCGTGRCQNLEGSYTCICEAGYCGHDCLLRDPCFDLALGDAAAGAGGGGNASGPCAHGGACSQRCSAAVDYVCLCADGWTGRNCTELEGVSTGAWSLRSGWWAWALLSLGALAALGAVGWAMAARARRQRATRGTYSPSGQEYRNPRQLPALKPPPEERLI